MERTIKFSSFNDEKYNSVKCVSNEFAYLEYYLQRDGVYVIQEIDSSKPGEGKKVVQAFVDLIGPDRDVIIFPIIEINTRQRLSELGVLGYVERNKKQVVLTAPNIFKSLKIARVLLGGGLNVTRVIVYPIPDNIVNDLGPDYLNPRASVTVLCRT